MPRVLWAQARSSYGRKSIRPPISWNYLRLVPQLKLKPALILEADDRNTSDNQVLADLLRQAGDAQVTEIHMHTDHPFSDHRIAMQAAVVNWLQAILPGPR